MRISQLLFLMFSVFIAHTTTINATAVKNIRNNKKCTSKKKSSRPLHKKAATKRLRKKVDLSGPSKALMEKARPLVLSHLDGGVMTAKDAMRIQRKLKISTRRSFMAVLAEVASDFAQSPVYNYPVGAVGRIEKTGEFVLGFNLEFEGHQPGQTVHAERAVVALAHQRGLGAIGSLYSNSKMCAGCIQFLFETKNGSNMKIHVEGRPTVRLSDLLTDPHTWGVNALLAQPPTPQKLVRDNIVFRNKDLVMNAVDEASRSYVLLEGAQSAVAIKTVYGRLYKAANLEISGTNDSLPPLQSALVAIAADGIPFHEIQEVVLVESATLKHNHASAIRDILQTIAPKASFEFHKIEPIELLAHEQDS